MKITDLTSESVAGPEKCWPGHRKVGTKPGTGKNAGKRVNDCEKIKEQGVAEGATADMRAFFAQEKEKNPIKPSSDKVFKSKVEYDRWLEQQKDKNVVKNKQAFKVTEGVIIGPSESGDPMDPQVAVLGGAGSYSLKGLYNKAQRESAQLTKDIGLGNFRSSAYNVKQLENTLNTIVAAHNELEAIRKGGGAKSRGIERGVDTKE